MNDDTRAGGGGGGGGKLPGAWPGEIAEAAHGINNMLGAITGFAELMLLEMDEQDPKRRSAKAILDAAARAGSLTSRLLKAGGDRTPPAPPSPPDAHAGPVPPLPQ